MTSTNQLRIRTHSALLLVQHTCSTHVYFILSRSKTELLSALFSFVVKRLCIWVRNVCMCVCTCSSFHTPLVPIHGQHAIKQTQTCRALCHFKLGLVIKLVAPVVTAGNSRKEKLQALCSSVVLLDFSARHVTDRRKRSLEK